MPSGKVHATVSVFAGFTMPILVSTLSLVALGYILWPLRELLLLGAGCLLGVIITPDLDQDNRVRSHLVLRGLGLLPGMWWYYLWHAYSISFKHRSFLSHGPIISTFLRLTYLYFPCIILLIHNQEYSLVKRVIYSLISTVAAIPIIAATVLLYYLGVVDINIVVPIVIGLMVSDILHWAFDKVF